MALGVPHFKKLVRGLEYTDKLQHSELPFSVIVQFLRLVEVTVKGHENTPIAEEVTFERFFTENINLD
jgi:hypothetical protein